MANCPKCGYKLKFTDIKAECPGCGVNLMYYNHQERLAEDADKAEAEHIQMQPKIDRIKFAFVGTKLSIVRLVLLFLPIGMLFLPLVHVEASLPFKTIDMNVSILNIVMDVVMEMNFEVLIEMITGSDVTRVAFIFYVLAILYIFLAAIIAIIRIPVVSVSCSPKTNGGDRNITLSTLGIIFTVISMVSFVIFTTQMASAFGEMYHGTLSVGGFLVILGFVAGIVVDALIKKADEPVKYKDISEIVERVEKRKAEKEAALEEARRIVEEYENKNAIA
ncbi:MAG: hypothetical protein E7557_05805 [Ruminococcaceae bacterium]|nr:hypothetical protein [Oscillospiraceae bacterium]